MASPHNLLGLVNQLQNLELSFSQILMETVMKLSALTDANVFLLVETQEGRRFTGKSHLCEAYLEGHLGARGDDVEFEVDPSVSSLRRRPQRRRQRRHRTPSSRRSSGGSDSPGTIKRRRRDGYAASPWRPSLVNGADGRGDARFDGTFETDAYGDVKIYGVVGAAKTETARETRVDGAVDETTLDEQTGLLTSTGDAASEMAPFPFDVDDAAPVANGLVPYLHHQGLSSRAKTYADDEDLEDCRELNERLLKTLPPTLTSKLEGLSQFRAGPNIEPGSAEFRLLNSILYEFGIHVRSFCPFRTVLPTAKKFLYFNLDALITSYPILGAIVTRGGKFPIGSRQITKLTYFREKTKKAFMKYVKSGPGGRLEPAVGLGITMATTNDDAEVEAPVGVSGEAQLNGHLSPPFAQHRLELQEFAT